MWTKQTNRLTFYPNAVTRDARTFGPRLKQIYEVQQSD